MSISPTTLRRRQTLLDLPLRLDPARGSQPLQVHASLRGAILEGRLTAGLRLPSSRELARQLRVRRNVVVAAYEHLLSDGLVEARTGAGTYAAAELPARARPVIRFAALGGRAGAAGTVCTRANLCGARLAATARHRGSPADISGHRNRSRLWGSKRQRGVAPADRHSSRGNPRHSVRPGLHCHSRQHAAGVAAVFGGAPQARRCRLVRGSRLSLLAARARSRSCEDRADTSRWSGPGCAACPEAAPGRQGGLHHAVTPVSSGSDFEHAAQDRAPRLGACVAGMDFRRRL